MRKVLIVDWRDVNVKGVHFAHVDEQYTHREDYFTCTPMPLRLHSCTNDVVCGVLNGWHHTPVFRIWETHRGQRSFTFSTARRLCLFAIIKMGSPTWIRL